MFTVMITNMRSIIPRPFHFLDNTRSCSEIEVKSAQFNPLDKLTIKAKDAQTSMFCFYHSFGLWFYFVSS